jgi:hypothetical protein
MTPQDERMYAQLQRDWENMRLARNAYPGYDYLNKLHANMPNTRETRTAEAIAYLRERGKYCLDIKVQKGATRPQREVPFWRRVAEHLNQVEGRP